MEIDFKELQVIKCKCGACIAWCTVESIDDDWKKEVEAAKLEGCTFENMFTSSSPLENCTCNKLITE